MAGKHAQHSAATQGAGSPDRAPFFSLIMPAYGVERYIMDSVADILCQSWADFELIIVDDASPDRSASIAAEVCCSDPRVKILHHETNRGVSEARNTGIREACGTWLLFPDPDDRYDTDMLERVARAIEETDAQLIVFAHSQEYFDADGRFLYSNAMPLDDETVSGREAVGRAALALEKGTHLGYPWNKAYRADIVRECGLAFETVPYIEDILFNIGVVTGMLPTKGLALPFISYGGTNLVTALAAVGLLFNVGRQIDSSQPRLHRSPIPA